MKNCEADDCDEKTTRAKYCNKHYLRNLRHGDPNFTTKAAKGTWKGIQCAATDCEREASIKGICTMHYSRDFRLKQKGLPYNWQTTKESE